MTIKPGFQTLVINLLSVILFLQNTTFLLDGVSAKIGFCLLLSKKSIPNLICILKPPMLLQFDQRKFSQLKGGQVRLTKLKYLIDKKQRVIYIKRRQGEGTEEFGKQHLLFSKVKRSRYTLKNKLKKGGHFQPTANGMFRSFISSKNRNQKKY